MMKQLLGEGICVSALRISETGTLAGAVVVDATDQRGEMWGRLVADLGAGVVKRSPSKGVHNAKPAT